MAIANAGNYYEESDLEFGSGGGDYCGDGYNLYRSTTVCDDVMKKELSKAGREELALALILLKDFKAAGKFDPDMVIRVIEFADYLGVREEFDELLPQIPPMKIEERYPSGT